MATIMQGQGEIAKTNPNIISNTYTADQAATNTTPMRTPAQVPTGQPTSPQPAPAQVPTSTPGVAQATGIATNLSNQLYGGGTIAGLESNRDAQLKELFGYDQQLDQVYSGKSPYPQVEGYVENPADRMAGLANVYGQTAANVERTTGQIDVTERAYNTAISNVLDRFMSFMQLNQAQQQYDKDYELKRQELEIKRQQAGVGTKTMKGVIESLRAAQNLPEDQKQNALMDALSQVEPNDVDKVMSIWQSLGGTGQLTDNDAILQAYQYPGAKDIMTTVNPESRGDLARKIIARGGTTGLSYKDPDAATGKELAGINAQMNTYNSLLEAYKNVGAKGFGVGMIGQLGAATQLDPVAKSYADQRLALATQIARAYAGETGQITEKDIARAMKAIPPLTENLQSAAKKFADLYNSIAVKQSAISGEPTKLANASTATLASLPAFQISGVQGNVTPNTNVYAAEQQGPPGMVHVMNKQLNKRGWVEREEAVSNPAIYQIIP